MIFENLTKNKISDFSKAEVQGWILDEFSIIENSINKIIIEYFNLTNNTIFEKVVLNNSVVNIGGKIKILNNIGIKKGVIEKLRKLSSIRNGFAHSWITEHIIVSPKKNSKKLEYYLSESKIEVMNSSGKIITKSVYEYVSEFFKLKEEIKQAIRSL